MNVFRIIADYSHVLAIIGLLVNIVRTKSCEGVSGKTQALYFVVFVTRYTDLFTSLTWYLTIFKAVFLVLTFSTLVLIYHTYKKTYDKNIDTFQVLIVVLPSIACGVIFSAERTSIQEDLWTFSIFLESVAILPQLYMIYQTGEAKTITVHYLLPLGLYRALYIANWVWRYYYERYFDPVAIVCGCIQTMFYILFVTMPVFWSGTKVEI
nr:ER lumen protein-retaining receptor 3 isoform X1 [Ciona intestinalis]|eukprot:XP_026694822.1 ER lumen protein-retaining receptor 3 isoform X1 [Ciona intestinalis]